MRAGCALTAHIDALDDQKQEDEQKEERDHSEAQIRAIVREELAARQAREDQAGYGDRLA